jgi:hypothetical protein
MVLSNPTTRTGVVEYGLKVNGGNPLTRDIVLQIPAAFLQTVGFSVPLTNAYTAGQTLELVARVTTNNNNQFSLTMNATPADPATMRLVVVGASGGGIQGPPGPQGPVGPQGPAGPAGADGATGPAGPTGPAGADGATGPAGPTGPAGAPNPLADAVKDLNSVNYVKQWIGTQAQYDALGTWDATTFYNITDATGTAGPPGPQGPAGPTGPQGPAGPTGPTGADGAQGPTGGVGPAGADGAPGATGATGPQGPPGPSNVDTLRATASWTNAQIRAQANPSSPSNFASIALHVADSVSAPQVGFQWDNVNGTIGFFDTNGVPLFGLRTPLNHVVVGAKVLAEGSRDNQVNLLWRGTQAEYDAIATKDPNTWYAIVG